MEMVGALSDAFPAKEQDIINFLDKNLILVIISNKHQLNESHTTHSGDNEVQD